MADDVIHRRADGFWKTMIVERRGVGVVRNGVLMHQRVDLVGGDARPDMGLDHHQGVWQLQQAEEQDWDGLFGKL